MSRNRQEMRKWSSPVNQNPSARKINVAIKTALANMCFLSAAMRGAVQIGKTKAESLIALRLKRRSGAIALFYPDRRMVYLANVKGLNLVAGAFPVETLALDHYGQIIFGEMQFAFDFDVVAFFQCFRVAAEIWARTDDAMPFNAGKPLVSFDSPNAGGNAELQQGNGVSRDSVRLGYVSIIAQEAAQLDDIFKEFHIHDSSLRRTCRLRGIVLGNGIGIEVLFALLCRTRQFLERCGPYLP